MGGLLNIVGFVPHDIDSSFRSVHKKTEQTLLQTEMNQTQLNQMEYAVDGACVSPS